MNLEILNWSGASIFDRPASAKALSYQRDMPAKAVGPFGHAFRFAVGGEHSVVSPIASLHRVRCPTAVFWGIVTRVVAPFKRQAWGSRPHVGDEILKAVPPLADSDAAPAVIAEGGIIRITAPLEHACPDVVFRRPCLPMSDAISATPFLGQAAAGLRAATAEFFSAYNELRSALTLAKPARSVRCAIAYALNHGMTAKYPPRHVNKIVSSHDAPPVLIGQRPGRVISARPASLF